MSTDAFAPNVTEGLPRSGSSSCTGELDLRGTSPALLAQVRRWTAAELVDLGGDHLHDVTMVAVELVTNAYEHGGGPGRLRMTRTRMPCSIGVEVEDFSADELTLGVSRFGERANRGRGLTMVDKIAESWGVIPYAEAGAKTVWARISCENSPCPDINPDVNPGADSSVCPG